MPKDDDEEWVRLYNFIAEDTSMKGNGSYLSTQAIMVRLGMCECNLVSPEVAHMVKRLTNTFGMETFDDPHDPDLLCIKRSLETRNRVLLTYNQVWALTTITTN